MKILDKISKLVEKVIIYFAVIGLAAMLVIIFYQVIARYVFNNPPSWSEEISLLIMIWISLLGAGVGVRSGIHMKVELFTNLLPEWFKKTLEFIVLILIGSFGYVMAKYSYILSVRLPNRMPATGIPVWWMYLPAMVSGILIIFSVFIRITVDVFGRRRK
ncbi:TRAP transporter small permease [Thermotoga sp. KOL6]|uniref:TRAP transporter small permease n=1 Tax=Thermotoga sp. KOL6 TaxID=126741 RepID=UPI000C773FFD|nr:TRAP transporter small permease [Thermotoga sp. KOL6]PLV59167.1 C4-dicarboxylate ABC transporter permease [Thermotoga sp. KOL6]